MREGRSEGEGVRKRESVILFSALSLIQIMLCQS